MSTAISQGIRVTVTTLYVPTQSDPAAHRYVFACTYRVANEGSEVTQLRSHHLIITDGHGKVQDERAPGVVKQQPLLKPGDHFEYTAGCIIETPRGTVRGTYQMHNSTGKVFDAEIAPFDLAMPHSLN